MQTQKQQHSGWVMAESLEWSIPRHLKRDIYFAMKRLIDIVGSMAAILILGIPMLIIAIAIKLDSPGPVIFKQQRVGARRRKIGDQEVWDIYNFTFYKFRSMTYNADQGVHRQYVQALIRNDKESLSQQNGDGEAQNMHKLVNDRRITRVGAFIRGKSLDELPQFFNALKGNISLVGPRPPIPYELEAYEPWHHRRMMTKPGVSGWWQVTARNSATFDEMVELDIWYIENQSVWLDLEILAKTPKAILSGKNAR